MEWSEIESIDGSEIEQKRPKVETISDEIMTIMWGGNEGKFWHFTILCE